MSSGHHPESHIFKSQNKYYFYQFYEISRTVEYYFLSSDQLQNRQGKLSQCRQASEEFQATFGIVSSGRFRRSLTSSLLHMQGHTYAVSKVKKKPLTIRSLTETNIIKSRWLQMLRSSVRGSIK